ncbi:MAG: LacI family transcriptional regulator [Cyanobacteria bacterium]|nr:LacI family transcriptional regulator [Cyanobacteriota bacterium]
MASTIKEIAKKAGVSIATVSRVINDFAGISLKTKQRVLEAIDELNYKPFAQAQDLIKKELKIIGLIISDLKNYFIPLLIKGLEEELRIKNYNIFLCDTNENINIEKEYLETLQSKGVNGIVFLGTRPIKSKSDYISKLSNNIPVLIINDYVIGSNIYSVMTDEVEGSYKAVSYLIASGHNKIAFINGNTNYTTFRYKLKGYLKALHDNNITINPDYIIKDTPYEIGGYNAANKLLAQNDKPTAILTASDQIAVGVYRAIYEKGFKIPDDFSIIGYSGIPLAAELYPPLTTVDQFPYNTGKIAGSVLIKLIEKENLEQKRIILEPKLVIRESCKSVS